MNAQANWAQILDAVRRELRSGLAGRKMTPGKRFRIRGDLVCLAAEADPSSQARILLHLDPLIRPYVPKEILDGIQDALEEEKARAGDKERRRQLDHRISKLRMPPPTRAMLTDFTLRGFHLAEGKIVSLGDIVFDENGDAELVLPAGSAVSVGFEVPALTFRVLARLATPANVVELGLEAMEVAAAGAEGLALAAAAAAEETEGVRDDRILRDNTDPSGLRLFATPVGGGERSRLTVETPDGGLDGRDFELEVYGRKFGAKLVWEEDRCVGRIELDIPFDELEASWPPRVDIEG